MAYTWVKQHNPTGEVSTDRVEWQEPWTVYGYTAGPNSVPCSDLIADNPSLGLGAAHPSVIGAYVTNFSPEAMSSRDNIWRVTVTYRNRDDSGVAPHLRPAVITMNSETVYVPTLTWKNGDPIINTAGGLISGVERPVNHWIFHVEKNVTAIPAWTLNYDDAVNSDAVNVRGLNIAAHYLMLQNFGAGADAVEVIGGVTYPYIPIAFDLIYNPLDWKTRLFNMGLYQNYGGKRVPCIDANGEKATEPMFLMANGEMEVYPPSVSEAAFIAAVKSNMREGWLYDLLPFAALPLT